MSPTPFGFGFAQGKTMLWRRADLERAGGIEALAKEVAEDAASTKIVRDAGLKVRLVDQPFAQPLGYRSAAEVWHRQLRWARLRRASFLAYFLPEAVSGGVLPMVALAGVAMALDLPPTLSVAALGAVWYGSEMLLAAAAGWHLSAALPALLPGARPPLARALRQRDARRRLRLARQRNAGRTHAAARHDGAGAAPA